MRLRTTVLVGVLTVALITGPGLAASAQLSGSVQEPVSTPAGNTVIVTYSVTNTGESTASGAVTVKNSSLPAAWSVTQVTGNDPNPQDNFAVISGGMQVAFSDIDPGETVTVSAEVSVPAGTTPETYTLPFELTNMNGQTVAVQNATISVSSPISFAAPPSVTIEPGAQKNITFTVENAGTSTQAAIVSINNSSAPADWTISHISGEDPNPIDQFAVLDNGSEIVFSDIDAGEQVTVSATVAVSADTMSGNYTVQAVLKSESGATLETTTADITVKNISSPTERYDKDGNGIETFEVLDAVNDYRQGQLQIYSLLEVVQGLRGS